MTCTWEDQAKKHTPMVFVPLDTNDQIRVALLRGFLVPNPREAVTGGLSLCEIFEQKTFCHDPLTST